MFQMWRALLAWSIWQVHMGFYYKAEQLVLVKISLGWPA